jgi:hypothetical protein
MAIPVIEQQELSRWATEQSTLVYNSAESPVLLWLYASIIRGCAGDTGRLPITAGKDGWLSAHDISVKHDLPDEILLIEVPSYHPVGFLIENRRIKIDEDENVFIFKDDADLPYLWSSKDIAWPESIAFSPEERRHPKPNTLKFAVIESLA